MTTILAAMNNFLLVIYSTKNGWKIHHHVIYASEPTKAVAFETTLLEDEDL